MAFLIIGFLLSSFGAGSLYLSFRNKLKQKRQNSQISSLLQQKATLIQEIQEEKEKRAQSLKTWEEQEKEKIDKYLEEHKKNIHLTIQKSKEDAAAAIQQYQKQVEQFKLSSGQEREEIQTQIYKLKTTLAAGIRARLREQEKKEKLNFYKLSISDSDLSDVNKLENLKESFHKPVVLSKLIWTQYFQKQTTELCDRILGKKIVSGIYKITNLSTGQCYIGQARDVSKRWKEHVKCGLGIDAPATNTLYRSMQKDKIWNFTFQLLEECPIGELNEKERFWIETYQSNVYGLNTLKGITK